MKKLIAIIAIAVAAGCSTQRPLVGSDGQPYVLVKKADQPVGVVVDSELGQRVGEVGDDKPFYTRRLQAPSDTSAPIFSKVR
jgi:hypothetical protein